jgi:hypothetical protein
MRHDVVYYPLGISLIIPKAHHILAEIIQGGLVLETNVDEIDAAGTCGPEVFTGIYFIFCEQYNGLPRLGKSHLRRQIHFLWG